MLGSSIGLSTLRTAQAAMDLIGQNVANAATPGYSRRIALFGANDPLSLGRLSLGTGVGLLDLQRVHDALLETRLREQHHALGRLDTRGDLLRSLEGLLQEPGDSGLAARLDEMWGAFGELTSAAGDASLRDALVQSALTMTSGFRSLAGQMNSVGLAARGGVAGAVDEVNGLLAEVAAVNARIVRAQSLGSTPGDLLDVRNRLLIGLSDWVDTQVVERPDGSVDVLVDGILLASGDHARTLVTEQPADGSVIVRVAGDDKEIDVGDGRLRGYFDVLRDVLPDRLADLDEVARELILQVNRQHATSVSALGPLMQITSNVTLPAGQLGDVLAALDLPFDPVAGRLTVNVVEQATGSVTQHFIDVDPDTMTLSDLAAALESLPHLSASLDSVGRLRIAADDGYGFDFSPRLDVDPDDAGSFGSDRATITSGAGPFALTAGDTLTLSADGGAPVVVTFNASDFADISQATAEEVAAVIEAQAGGVTALAQDGRLVLQSDTPGAAGSIAVTAASSSVLFAPGTADVGADQAVAVTLAGAPTAGHAGHFTVRALGDGVIGLTDGLQIELLDEDGARIGVFDVGSGYTPGDPIELVPGIELTLTAGSIGQGAGDVFEFDLIENSDTSDVLAALQLNAFFTGSGAADIELAAVIAADPRLVAGSRTGDVGNADGFLALVALKDEAFAQLGGRTIAQRYGDFVAGIGLEVRSTDTAVAAQQQLLVSLENRRDEISGVNLDEEMLRLLEAQHLYEAGGRYLQAVNEMTETLFQIL